MAPFRYELATVTPGGREERRVLELEGPLGAGDVVPFAGSHWLVERVDARPAADPLALAHPARYRLVLEHLDREEKGEVRDYREGGPGLGYSFQTGAGGEEESWTVVEQRLGRDELGRPVLELRAQREAPGAEREERELLE